MGIYDLFGGNNGRAYTSNSWVENQKALREQAFADADKCCNRIKESGAELSKYLTCRRDLTGIPSQTPCLFP